MGRLLFYIVLFIVCILVFMLIDNMPDSPALLLFLAMKLRWDEEVENPESSDVGTGLDNEESTNSDDYGNDQEAQEDN